MSLFPDDREIPPDSTDSIQVRLSGLELRRPRIFGSCWLACELWQQLGLDEFWQQRLPAGRESVSWEKVLRLLVVNRLLDPGSELRRLIWRHPRWGPSSPGQVRVPLLSVGSNSFEPVAGGSATAPCLLAGAFYPPNATTRGLAFRDHYG